MPETVSGPFSFQTSAIHQAPSKEGPDRVYSCSVVAKKGARASIQPDPDAPAHGLFAKPKEKSPKN